MRSWTWFRAARACSASRSVGWCGKWKVRWRSSPVSAPTMTLQTTSGPTTAMSAAAPLPRRGMSSPAAAGVAAPPEPRVDPPSRRPEPSVLLPARSRRPGHLPLGLNAAAPGTKVRGGRRLSQSDRTIAVVNYTPHTEDDVRDMLAVVGRADVDRLFDLVPPGLRAPEVLGLPIANSSLYDGATALVEGMIMCMGSTRRQRVVLAGALDPRYREILDTYADGTGAQLAAVPPRSDGTVDPQAVAALAEGAAAVIVQHPNCVGILEDVPRLAEVAHVAGHQQPGAGDAALAGVLEPPGRLGADVVVADGLSLGNGLHFGGPGVGLLACGV